MIVRLWLFAEFWESWCECSQRKQADRQKQVYCWSHCGKRRSAAQEEPRLWIWHLTSKWILTWFYLSIILPPISAWLNFTETPWLPRRYCFIFLNGPHRKVKQQVPSHTPPCGCTHSSSRVHLTPDVLRQDTDAVCMACTFEGGEKERLL